MSIKIKINWDNENVVSESVRIYRSGSLITIPTQAMLVATIMGDAYEYEDLDITEGQIYFYMLSAKLGDEEVFTECFEVEASTAIWINTSEFIIKFSEITSEHHAKTVTASELSYAISQTTGAYSGGVLAQNGKIYCIPSVATDILIIDPASDTATRSTMGANLSGSDKWWGGVLGADGKIYCVPSNAEDILIIDPATNTAIRSNMGLSLSGSNKWCGGVLAPNGKIYCAPYNSTDVLIIDTLNNTASKSNFGLSLTGSSKFYGGALASNGKIYFTPSYATNILVIDTVGNTASLSAMGADLSGVAKWYGCALGSNGKIYSAPYNSGSILVIDPISNTASRTAFELSNMSDSAKWWGVVLAGDGSIYGIPAQSSRGALKLKKDPIIQDLDLKYFLSPHVNKF